MSKNSLFFSFFLLVMVAIMVVILTYKKPVDRYAEVKDFALCAQAGGKIMESYPRQCALPNGKFFVEQIVETECSTKTDCPNNQACINNKCAK
ncbi:MAG: hypothetical protein WC794_03730 [Candidatus Doudnabacteria bacterium]|jgi:hypothetical protein